MEKLEKTLEEWRAMLDPEQYNVCRLKGTERPFSGKYNATNLHGVANVNCLELPFSVYDAPGISRTLPLPMMAYADHAYGTSMIDGYVSPTSSSASSGWRSTRIARPYTRGKARS